MNRLEQNIAAIILSTILLLLLVVPTAAQTNDNDVYLPMINGEQTVVTSHQESPQEGSDHSLNIEPTIERETAEAYVDPDVLAQTSEESRYQDGDGPWAEPPAGTFREQIESAVVNAFDANTWYVRDNLGVGTDTPLHRVELNDNVNWVNRLLIRNNNGGSDVSSDVYLTTGTAKGLMIQKFGSGFNKFNWSNIQLADYARIRTDTGVKGLIHATASGPMYFGTNDTERLRIHSNGGMTLRNTNNNFGLRIEDAQWDGLHINGAGGLGLQVNNPQSDGVEVNSPGLDGVRVYNSGDHGIYVNVPGGNGLLVNCPCGGGYGVLVNSGDIRVNAGSFIDDGTTLNVPDYVFEEDYPLMSLDELRAFIETEKHLPNVPSEDEIRADGLDLSAFHMHLLEKVEELTLYTLQQQEVIDIQRAEIEALAERLTALEAKD